MEHTPSGWGGKAVTEIVSTDDRPSSVVVDVCGVSVGAGGVPIPLIDSDVRALVVVPVERWLSLGATVDVWALLVGMADV